MSLRNATRIHDASTINANTGNMTKGEVVSFCNMIRTEIESKTGIDSRFVVNTITMLHEGQRVLKGVSFIYWEKSEAYHAILGNNIDGTERYNYYQDPDWVAPEKCEENTDAFKSWDEIVGDPNAIWGNIMGNSDKSWASQMEIDVEQPRMITEPLSPIIEDLTYTRSNGDKIDITVQPFFITIGDSEDSNIDTDKLFGFISRDVPLSEVKERFEMFSHRCNYPVIDIKPCKGDKNLVFITFSQATYDARFAREIMMFTQFGKDTVKFDFPRSLPSRDDGPRRGNYSQRPRGDQGSTGGQHKWGGNKGWGNRDNKSRNNHGDNRGWSDRDDNKCNQKYRGRT
jgi:hypothetical protein